MSNHASLRSVVRFAAGGVLSSSVLLGTSALLHEVLGIAEPVAAAGGIGAALIVNFVFLRYYVFRGSVVPPVRQGLMFLSSSGVFRGLEYLGFLVLNLMFKVRYLVALVIVLCVSFTLKFLLYDRWIFARPAGGKGRS
ncbi:MAG: GtrA family protein [Gemmatimonadales bacterium]